MDIEEVRGCLFSRPHLAIRSIDKILWIMRLTQPCCTSLSDVGFCLARAQTDIFRRCLPCLLSTSNKHHVFSSLTMSLVVELSRLPHRKCNARGNVLLHKLYNTTDILGMLTPYPTVS